MYFNLAESYFAPYAAAKVSQTDWGSQKSGIVESMKTKLAFEAGRISVTLLLPSFRKFMVCRPIVKSLSPGANWNSRSLGTNRALSYPPRVRLAYVDLSRTVNEKQIQYIYLATYYTLLQRCNCMKD